MSCLNSQNLKTTLPVNLKRKIQGFEEEKIRFLKKIDFWKKILLFISPRGTHGFPKKNVSLSGTAVWPVLEIIYTNVLF